MGMRTSSSFFLLPFSCRRRQITLTFDKLLVFHLIKFNSIEVQNRSSERLRALTNQFPKNLGYIFIIESAHLATPIVCSSCLFSFLFFFGYVFKQHSLNCMSDPARFHVIYLRHGTNSWSSLPSLVLLALVAAEFQWNQTRSLIFKCSQVIFKSL